MKKDELEDRLKRASQSYREKSSCTQAVLDAFAETAVSLPAQRRNDLCGVLRAAEAILRHSERPAASQALRQITERFRAEYGGVTCEEALLNADPSCGSCCMKVKNAVLLLHYALEQIEEGL